VVLTVAVLFLTGRCPNLGANHWGTHLPKLLWPMLLDTQSRISY
jgi:hypothetical protein